MDFNLDRMIKTEPLEEDHSSFENSLNQEMTEISDLPVKVELKTEDDDEQYLPSEDHYIVPDRPNELLYSSDSTHATSFQENGRHRLVNVFDAQPEDKKWLSQSNERTQPSSPTSVLDNMLNFEVDETPQSRIRRKQVLKPMEDLESDPVLNLQNTDSVQKPSAPLVSKRNSSMESQNRKEYHCKDCNKKMSTLSSFKTHTKRHKVKRQIKCVICLNKFKSLDDVNDHLFLHNNLPPYKCIICKKSFKSVARLSHHLTTHKGIKPYKCFDCETRFSRSNFLANHQKTCRTENGSYLCTNCKKTFSSAKTLKSHIVKHICSRPYECFYCSSSFTSLKCLSSHARNSHSNEKEHKCAICDKSFHMVHLLLRHHYVLNVKCQVCKQVLHNDCAFVKHTKIHDIVNEKADVFVEEMQDANARTMMGYSCKVCRKTFSERIVASKHVLKNHAAEFSVEATRNSNTAEMTSDSELEGECSVTS